ncbi:DUF4139 domain-containing protein [Beggiatoa leptomitoformis]|uniref:DUF4139 domain-containing protein n=1 Tax=Beggiatoa leptomitoformis TaxID=288004 RepID=A0A2N9YES4_9GAMM|nr:DUF4139 domain-containing protein [Beggiatoa leptomitoformis]ALG68661.1 DUF4139 domain-containing protein [Beggiatoa leptomitoformis]AUI68987.1 DUF4139 domain-containing protein [Beggiatoa leptomitoformis]
MRIALYATLVSAFLSTSVQAKIDLVTLPNRDKTQLTIYNSADLTLVREQRTLTLKQGINKLEFSWVNTLIDPTSVYLDAPQHQGKVKLLEVSYPPNVEGSAVWTIESLVAGEVPVEITFFTSGIAWRAFYMATLAPDEKTMRLENYVRVDNRSGEDYTNAQTRVIVGQINLQEEIATLAQRNPPYGSPTPLLPPSPAPMLMGAGMMEDAAVPVRKAMRSAIASAEKAEAKTVIKEGLSEYFLYTIEGTETIDDGWGKRLLSLSVEDIPVKPLYRYDERRYGNNTQYFLFFKNDTAHKLGEIPLPDGQLMVYQQLAEQQQLSYVGETMNQYIPVNQEVELNLGAAREVKVEPLLLEYHTANYMFDRKGNISGYDRLQTWQVKLQNNRALPVDIEIFRHLEHSYWTIDNPADIVGNYEKFDIDTVKYRFTLPANTEKTINYTLTLREGERRQVR